MYKRFAEEAREEGFEHIAKAFEGVAKIESEHEERYQKLLQNIKDDIVFKSDKTTVWKCRNCGSTHIDNDAPDTCPVCHHPKAFYEISAENY
jgi:rubrerythrin